MAKFSFRAKNTDGKTIHGSYFASDDQELREILANQNFYLVSYHKYSENNDFWSLSGSVKPIDLINFARQFGIMLHSGISIADALMTLKTTTKTPKMRKTLERVYSDVMNGISVSDALKSHPKIFPEFFVNMSQVGELTGTLDDVMNRLADYYENDNRVKQKVKTSMIYPIGLMVLLLGAIIVLSVFVLPMFEDLYDTFDQELPPLTQAVMGFSTFMRANIWYILLGIAVLVLLIPLMKKSKSGKKLGDKLAITFPIVRDINRAVYTSRFASGFSTLLHAGIPLVEAIGIIGRLLGNSEIEEKMKTVRSELERGQSVAKSLKTIGYFPEMLIEMVTIGEQTGQLEEVLNSTTAYFEEEVDRNIKRATSLIEPAMILIVGIIVGIAVLSIYQPLTGIMTDVKTTDSTGGLG